MAIAAHTDPAPSTAERISDRETRVRRRFSAPARLVWAAWTDPELFQRWWTPKSYGIEFLSCELDVRTGGSYRLVFKHPQGGEPMAFFGRYLEATPFSRIVWTNDESGEPGAITMVTFEERDEATLIEVRDLHPTKEALDEAIACGATGGQDETFAQLEALLASGAVRA